MGWVSHATDLKNPSEVLEKRYLESSLVVVPQPRSNEAREHARKARAIHPRKAREACAREARAREAQEDEEMLSDGAAQDSDEDTRGGFASPKNLHHVFDAAVDESSMYHAGKTVRALVM